ncbi:MAG: hypothetical protein M3Q44_02240 [bacterium]|nr:hypothetical protein [bacterium]
MNPQDNIKQLQDLFNQAKDILIITRETPTIDSLSACLALRTGLSQKTDSQGKQKRVTFAVSKRNGSQYSLLPGSDQIVSELGLRDLVIGVNGFVEGSIENVNWYIDKGRLNVVFKSNPAVPMQFDLKNLDPFYAGANFDVVLVVGADSPQELGNAYKQDPGMYAELPVVNISNSPSNTRFGRVNIVDPAVSSVSELAFQLAQIVQLNVMGEIATLFLTGISDATDNFTKKGPQTDTLVNQLTAFGGRAVELEQLRNQASLPPLAIHKTPPPAAQPIPGMNPQMPPQGYPPQYPPMQPPYPGYMPQPNQYGQYPMPPAGYYPSQYPQMPAQGYAPQYQPIPPQPSPQYPVAPPQEWSQEYTEEVPSIEHDLTQTDAYIPTGESASYSHVEPSLYMPNLPQQPDAYVAPDQDYQWNDQTQQYAPPVQQDAPLEERKESQKPPDFNSPPPGFNPGEKKS